MKKMSMTVSGLVLTFAVGSQAQLLNSTNEIKNARVQLEKENESKILEMLETQRLQEEKARMQKFEQISFSVLPERTESVVPTQVVQPAPAATQTF